MTNTSNSGEKGDAVAARLRWERWEIEERLAAFRWLGSLEPDDLAVLPVNLLNRLVGHAFSTARGDLIYAAVGLSALNEMRPEAIEHLVDVFNESPASIVAYETWLAEDNRNHNGDDVSNGDGGGVSRDVTPLSNALDKVERDDWPRVVDGWDDIEIRDEWSASDARQRAARNWLNALSEDECDRLPLTLCSRLVSAASNADRAALTRAAINVLEGEDLDHRVMTQLLRLFTGSEADYHAYQTWTSHEVAG